MKEKKEKLKIATFIFLAFIISSLIFTNFDYIYSDQVELSFDPYDPPEEPDPPSPHNPTPEPNEKPVANITLPEIGYLNETVIMHGNYSYDPDGTIVGYRWDFNNDGLFDTDWSENPFTKYIFNRTGNHTVRLQVKDNDGATDTDTEVIDIIEIEPEKEKPFAENNGPYFSSIGENVSFNSSGSYDPDGNITEWLWEFGDGTESNESKPTHFYEKSGSYIVTLTVKDNDGLIDQDFTTANINKKNISENKSEEPVSDSSKDQTILLLSLSSVFLAIIVATMIALIILKKNQNSISKNKESQSKKQKDKKKTKSRKKPNKSNKKNSKKKKGNKKSKKKTTKNKKSKSKKSKNKGKTKKSSKSKNDKKTKRK